MAVGISTQFLGTALVQRMLTAMVLVPLVLVAIFVSSNVFFAGLAWVVLLVAAWEWSSLVGAELTQNRVLYLVTVSLCILLVSLLSADAAYTLTFIWWGIALLMVVCYPSGSQVWGKPAIIAFMGHVTLSLTWYALVDLQSTEHGSRLVLFIMCIVWGADTGAYFFGRRWGARKLAPAVSPGKSIVGVLGGLLVSVSFSGLVLLELDLAALDELFYLSFTILTVFASVLGDLFESMLKRFSNVKDSGSILPGHGGVLDRIDSLTAAVPLFTAGLYFNGAFS